LHKIIISVVGLILTIVIGISIFISCRRSLRETKKRKKQLELLKLMNSKLNVDNNNYIICSDSSSESDLNNKEVKTNLLLNESKYYSSESSESKSKLINDNSLNKILNKNNNKPDIKNSNIWITNQDFYSLNSSNSDNQAEQVAKNLPVKKYIANEGIINVKTTNR
jgi:hypothetical protein